MKVGVFGLFGAGNFGNDASLEVMLNFLRSARPDVELVCINKHPDIVARNFAIATLPMRPPAPAGRYFRAVNRMLLGLPRALHMAICAVKQVSRFDALIIPGTGILDDFGERPQGVPLSLFLWCLAARCCGTKVAFVSVGAGPIHNRATRWLMKSAARMASYRSYRDQVSRSFMLSIGVKAQDDPVLPDVVFNLPAGQQPVRPRGGNGRLTVGIGVMAYFGWYRTGDRAQEIYTTYIGKLTTFAVWLLDRGHRVRLVIGDNSDWTTIGDLLKAIAASRPGLPDGSIAADTASSVHDVMTQLSETDIVVATRYHNVVCALMLGKPTISIGYAKKNDALLADMHLHDYCQYIESLDVDLLVNQFSRLVSDRARHEPAIQSTNTAFRERLRAQDALLASRILS
jgi:polysaccharide pyruvyl transferase WcaK-like protein